MGSDALEVILEDHERFRELLDRYEETEVTDDAAKRELVDRLIVAVVKHSTMEERAFYPFVMRAVPRVEDDVREEIEEHHVIELLMAELAAMDPSDQQFDAKVEVFAENLLHHLAEEEQQLFPVLRAELGRDVLVRLADELRAARDAAPTTPDPTRVG
jgi:hemerythrin-like domain-containing protein